jgi:hypothetical protein
MYDYDDFDIRIVNYPDSDYVPSSFFFDNPDSVSSDTDDCMLDSSFNDISNTNTHSNDFVEITGDTGCNNTINLYDYANEHLKTYKRFLCDKLPNKTYVDGDIKEICETAEASSDNNIDYNESWSWNPQGTSDISFTYEEWKNYKKDLNNDSREKQLKYDKKLQYNSKKFEIYSLLIVIPILLFILKKY